VNGEIPASVLCAAENRSPDVAYIRRLRPTDGYDLSEQPTTRVPIATLVLSNWLRNKGQNFKHVRILAQVEDKLPPIIVHRATMRVIDGMHRVRAAMLGGAAHLDAILFDGSEEEAFLLAVRLNVAHGLPLSRGDRVAAAVRIICSCPQWSDRAIARAAGLSDKTVASIRRRTSAEFPHLSDRVGLDGRFRPVSAVAGRRMASDLITENPDATIREISVRAGISLATARDVRERLRNGLDPVPARHRAPAVLQSVAEDDGGPRRSRSARVAPTILESLRRDPSLRNNEAGRALLRLLALPAMSPADWERLISAVPLHRAQAVAQVARGSSEAWQQFATRLEDMVQRSSAGGAAQDSPRGAGLAR
jgi:ParB-like chromosome segregation protein Spo0J